MKLEQTVENPDGSADFIISDMTDEEVMSFVRLGIVKALEDAIEDAKKYDPALVPEPVKKREWVGLTNAEAEQLYHSVDYYEYMALIFNTENLLREKNT